ncbi:MAG: cation diffusion facilitator family transporter [Gemmataceae bacterium]
MCPATASYCQITTYGSGGGFVKGAATYNDCMAKAIPRYPVVLSILAALATLGMKFGAYALTGSVGLLSDAAESCINLLTALIAFVCLWYATRPVDENHTYGHEKIEYFSSGLEGIFILLAAAGIAWAGIERLLEPQPLEALGFGTLIALAASLINLGVGVLLVRVGKQTGSILLEADGHHLLTDVWTSGGVVAGLLIVWMTGWNWLDPIIALLVAINIVWTAVHLVVRSFNGLMDHALAPDEQGWVRRAIEAALEPGVTYHAMRTRQAGIRRFVDFHLLVPGVWSVQRAHALAEKVEEALHATLPGLEITIHIEPIEEEASWRDSELLNFEAGAGVRSHESGVRSQGSELGGATVVPGDGGLDPGKRTVDS